MAEASGGLDERLTTAHRAMRARGDIQMDMDKAPQAPPPPQWLRSFIEWLSDLLEPVARFFGWINSLLPDLPYVQVIFWAVIGALLLLFLWMAIERLRHGAWRLPRLRRRTFAAAVEEEEDWRPDATPARAWLEEADALAARGHYAEAAHHLLLRSIEDLARRRPRLVRPAITSRDLARAQGIPALARQLFAHIAAVVERSLFGGRPVGPEEWTACRAAYADFTQTRSWRT